MAAHYRVGRHVDVVREVNRKHSAERWLAGYKAVAAMIATMVITTIVMTTTLPVDKLKDVPAWASIELLIFALGLCVGGMTWMACCDERDC